MTDYYVSQAAETHADLADVFRIQRRGVFFGYIQKNQTPAMPDANRVAELWADNQPAYLPAMLKHALNDYKPHIQQSRVLYQALLQEQAVEDLLDAEPYINQLGERFELLSTRFDESDRQEIVSVDFDVLENGELVMEDIWMRISWLSFHEQDSSLRFRFSFGMEGYEDVSLDYDRQIAAAELCQRLFPESSLISSDSQLEAYMQQVLGIDEFQYLERIVYFNAPNGGAQFHHDAEKGHLGVVYAQVSGRTFWLALSKQQLMHEIELFSQQQENFQEIKLLLNNEELFKQFAVDVNNTEKLSAMLDDPANEEISVLINQSTSFFQQLLNKGYAYVLEPGDVILLPQASMQACAWHSVFCIGDEAGEALSFAIKPVA